MDEPASALDPRATAELEALIDQLRKDFAIVIVAHNMQQAARVAFFHLGQLVEQGDTDKVFVSPRERLTHDYVIGRFR